MVLMLHCVVIVLLIKVMLSAHRCNIVIKCADPLNTNGNCLQRTIRDEINFYNYTRCKDGTVCEKNEVTGDEVFVKCIEKAQRKNLYDGQECEKDEQCYSKNCTNYICLGKMNGTSCKTTDECATRHYCKKASAPEPESEPEPEPKPDPQSNPPIPPVNSTDPPRPIVPPISTLVEPLIPLISLPPLPTTQPTPSNNEEEGVCTPQEKLGQICKEEYDCINNATCGAGNQCVEYFSYENGESSDFAILCKSNQIGNKKSDNLKICVEYERVEKENECKPEQNKCTYKTIGNQEGKVNDVSQDCICSLGSADKTFCPYNPQDTEYKKYLDLLKEYYRVEAHDYHTKQRHESVDPQLKKKMFIYKNYPRYFEVDDCAIEFGMTASFVFHSYFIMLSIIVALLI